MNHSDIQSRMASYLDGELSLDARALFDAHLDQCDACSRELAEMRDTIRLLRMLPSPEPPADLVSNVMRRIAEGEGQQGWFGLATDRLSRWFVPRFAIPATAAAAALTLTVLSGDLSLDSLDLRLQPGESELSGLAIDVGRVRSEASLADVTSTRPLEARAEVRQRAGTPIPRVAKSSSLGRYRDDSGAGPFLYRVANDPLGPIRRQPREGDVADRILFMSNGPRMGPYLGASAAPPTGLGARQFRVGSASMQPNSGASFGRRLTPVSVSRELSSTEDGQGDLSGVARRQRELDAQLKFLKDDPTGFARRQSQLSLAEQEHWLREMAARALEIGDVERVISALEGSGDEGALYLAQEFVLAVDRNRHSEGGSWTTAAEASPGSD